MSRKSSQSLQIELIPSLSLLILRVTLHLLAALAVALAAIPLGVIIFLLTLVSGSLFYTIRDFISPPDRRVSQVSYKEGKGWCLTGKNKMLCDLKLLPSTVSTRFCLFMHFEGQDKSRHHFLIARDSLPFDGYRQLRVLLKISGLEKLEQ